jgi:hypothetical protein
LTCIGKFDGHGVMPASFGMTPTNVDPPIHLYSKRPGLSQRSIA